MMKPRNRLKFTKQLEDFQKLFKPNLKFIILFLSSLKLKALTFNTYECFTYFTLKSFYPLCYFLALCAVPSQISLSEIHSSRNVRSHPFSFA